MGGHKPDPGQDPGFEGQIFWPIERFAIKRGNDGKIFTFGGMGK